MITRSEVIGKACIDCLKELYSKVQPEITWDEFMQQNKEYSVKYNQWIQMENRPPIEEFCGLRPYEFYYLPREVMKEIADSYVRAYKLDEHSDLLTIIKILREYCDEPIEEAYVEESNGEKRRSYIHPLPLQEWIAGILRGYYNDSECGDHITVARELCEEFYHYLDKAGKFYTWNRDLNEFNTSVYLGPSPNSNKEKVIENWKKYRNKSIVIDDSLYIEDEDD